MMSGCSDPLLHMMNGLFDKATTTWKMDKAWLDGWDKDSINGKCSADANGLRLVDGGYFEFNKPILDVGSGTLMFWFTWNGGDVVLFQQRNMSETDSRKSVVSLAIANENLLLNGEVVCSLSEVKNKRTSLCLAYTTAFCQVLVDGEVVFERKQTLTVGGEFTRLGYSFKPVGLDVTIDNLTVWDHALSTQLSQRLSSIGNR